VCSSALVLLALTACASTAASSEAFTELPEVTLVESKSPVQFLRNEAASRIPEIVTKSVTQTDESVSCLDAADDPDGLARSWSSTATFILTNSQAARVETVTANLVATFTDQDWVGEGKALTKEGNPATLSIEAIAKSEGQVPEIVVTVTGPCVLTDGPDSDEVLELEGTV
jgi:hypothetical protein